MTTILFDATRLVKPASRTFGRGILPTRATQFVPTPEDCRWAAETSPTRDLDYDVIGPADDIIEARTAAFFGQAKLDAGCLPF